MTERSFDSSKRLGLWLCIAAVILAGFIFAISSFKEETPLSVVQNQLNSIKNHQLTEAYYAYTSKEFQATTSLDDFKKFINTFPILTHFSEKNLKNMPDQNELKSVKSTFTDASQHFMTLYFQLIKEGEAWKILNIKTTPHEDEVSSHPQNDEYQDILQPIEEQLDALNEGNIKQAYEATTSNEFKKATSFTDFQKFLSKFPILIAQPNFKLIDASISMKDRSAVIKAEFQNVSSSAEIEYILIKKNQGWVIRGIKVLSQKNSPSADFDVHGLLDPIQSQLKAIQNGHLKSAYEDFTAEAFKKATSFQDFESFLEKYPIFKNHQSVDFYKLSFDNNIGIYNALFKGSNNEQRQVEYSLIEESDTWKILQIQIAEN